MRVAAAAGAGPAMAVWTRATKAGLVELLLRERWVRVVAELSGESLSLTGDAAGADPEPALGPAAAAFNGLPNGGGVGDSVSGRTSHGLPGQNQEPETPTKSPTWVAGAQVLVPSSPAFPGSLAVSWRAEQLGLKPVLPYRMLASQAMAQPAPMKAFPFRSYAQLSLLEIKFIREVTPYIKKPSLVSDLPWEGAAPQSPSFSGSEDSGSPKHQNSTKDRKVIPLKMCFAARNLSMPDLENRLIELHSPDSRNTLILRCKDTATAHSWFVAIHTNIMALLPQVLAELNTMLGATSTAGGSKEVKHIAWLAEQAKLDGGRQQWRPILMAVTEKDLLLYDCMPWTRDAWASPCHSYPLVATRLVHSGSGCRSPSLGSDLTFATRTGSRQGIEMHLFRVETHRDLSTWTRTLVQGCHAAAELIKEVSLGCTLNGQEVRFTVHYENGFTISREDAGASSILYRYPFERLKMSADDGIRNLYLDFGGPEGELTMDLHSCPKPIVFVLHTFLSAKVTRMGLLV
uniref:Syntrophin beta 2 n=1 Tax=Oryctolagus cuniculus TaxID=9986 RepID=G1TI00_RABIT